MVDFVSAYGLDDELASRLHYCGYLGRDRPGTTDSAAARNRPLVIGTSGGGVDGPALAETFVRAAATLRPTLGGTWLAVTGPLMAEEDHARIVSLAAGDDIGVHRVIPELRNTIASADCVVSMAGYNTVCDIMSYRRRSVLVPRAHPSEEQLLRTQRLRDWGVADVIQAGELHASGLSEAIVNALDRPEPPPAPVPLNGLEMAVDVFDSVCDRTELVPFDTGRSGRKATTVALTPARLRNPELSRSFGGDSRAATLDLLGRAAQREHQDDFSESGETAIADADAETQKALTAADRAETREILASCARERERLEAEAERLRELISQICANLRSGFVAMLDNRETRTARTSSQDVRGTGRSPATRTTERRRAS